MPFHMTFQRVTSYAARMGLEDRCADIFPHIKLPHGWTLQLVKKLEFQGADPDDGHIYPGGGCLFLRVGDPKGTCNVTGKPLPWWGRKFYISPHMTDGEIVQTVFMATMAASEHETREGFLYKGQSVFDPHYDIEKLVELRARPDALIERQA